MLQTPAPPPSPSPLLPLLLLPTFTFCVRIYKSVLALSTLVYMYLRVANQLFHPKLLLYCYRIAPPTFPFCVRIYESELALSTLVYMFYMLVCKELVSFWYPFPLILSFLYVICWWLDAENWNNGAPQRDRMPSSGGSNPLHQQLRLLWQCSHHEYVLQVPQGYCIEARTG